MKPAPLATRQARYERIMAMRRTSPPTPYEEIGEALDPPISKERVRQIIDAGPPKRTGRPAGPQRRIRLESRLGHWEAVLKRAKTAADRMEAHARIDAITADLIALDGE